MKSEVRYEVSLQASDDGLWNAPVSFATEVEAKEFLGRKLRASRYRNGFIERVRIVHFARVGDPASN